jgi:hypothetical protein
VWAYTGSTESNHIQQRLYSCIDEWMLKMYAQSDNLVDGYTAVKTAYPEKSAMLDGVISGQTAIFNEIGNTTDVKTYRDSANTAAHFDTILDSILGNSGTAREAFDKDYAAFAAGKYYNQKVNDKDIQDFTDALAQTDLASQDISTPTAIANVLSALETRMLAAINGKMSVSGMPEADQNKIGELNTYLINQMADHSQLQAVIDDITGLSYGTDLPKKVSEYSNSYITQAAPANDKAAHPIYFDPELLRQPAVNKNNGIAMA